MTDYQKLYHLLFNAITDALEEAQTRAEDHILEEP